MYLMDSTGFVWPNRCYSLDQLTAFFTPEIKKEDTYDSIHCLIFDSRIPGYEKKNQRQKLCLEKTAKTTHQQGSIRITF